MTEADDWVDSIMDTAGMPIKSSSLFYTTYYLSETKGDEEADFDLFKITNEQYEGMYRFGIHSMIYELGTLNNRLIINGTPSGDVGQSARNRYIRNNIPREHHSMAMSLVNSICNIDIISGRKTRLMRKGLIQAEEEANILSNVDKFVEVCRNLFDDEAINEDGRHMSAIEVTDTDLTGWSSGFGGSGWKRVADFMSQHDELPKRAWVDLAWGIEHNTGNWISKVKVDEMEKERIAANNVEVDSKWYDTSGGISDTDVRNILEKKILDQNKKGNMGSVFDMAVIYNDMVDIDLRRTHKYVG